VDKLEEIIEISAKMFADKGFDKTTTRDIAKATNLTSAGLYYFIDSKDDLLNKAEEYFVKKIREEAYLKAKKADINPKERLNQILKNMINLALNHKEIVSLLKEKSNLLGKFGDESRLRRKGLVKQTKDIFDQLKKEGVIRKNVDTTIAVYSFISIINFVPEWFKPNGRINRNELIDKIFDSFFDGVGSNREKFKVTRKIK